MNTPEVLLRFDPLDSLFFRDGRPYTKDESEQLGVTSQFPPTPATMVGALRAAVARGLGWSGYGTWSDDIKQVLGDRASLGPLGFRGPLLVRGDDMLFPAPAHLLRDGTDTHTALLQPGPPRDCDLGPAVRLPVLPDQEPGTGWKPTPMTWLTALSLQAVLDGKPLPQALIKQTNLWKHEARVGIARNVQTHTTEDAALYSPQHVRLQPGVGLGLWVRGLTQEIIDRLARIAHPLGGESRAAWITPAPTTPAWPALPETLHRHNGELYYSVIVLSPLPLANAPRPHQPVPGLPGTLLSASLPRPLMLGGWDSLQRQPLALQPHLAPGSTLFMRAQAADETAIRALHGTCIGERPAWGYGLVATGTWN